MNKNTKEDCEMKKEEYLSLIDEVIAQGPYTDTWDSLCEHPTPKWYARDKFGIFIHWGVYSVPAFGNEWYPRNMYVKGSKENLHHIEKYGTLDKFGYKDFIPQFKAEKFDPKEWAALFKEAGAKFVVPVAEHHDGFQMYASDLCRWNAAEMGPKRDILGELKTEVEKEGMVLGASSHRAEHYWFFNGGRQIPEADVNDPEYADLYGPVAGITRDMSRPPWKATVPEAQLPQKQPRRFRSGKASSGKVHLGLLFLVLPGITHSLKNFLC